MVFGYVFQDEDYCIGPGYWMEDYPSLRRNLSLLLVSRQLYHETVLLPYKLAVFQLLYHSYEHSVLIHLKGFLRGRSKAQIEVMVRVGCYDSLYMKMAVMGTGVYWAATLQLT